MNKSALVCFAAGFAILIGLVAYVGVEPVAEAAASLGLGGLALVSIVRLGVIALLGFTWALISSAVIGGRPADFVWARLVREAAGEVLPFSQVGGYAAGVRALTLAKVKALPATLSTFADLIVEFWGKLPYLALGIALLSWLRPQAGFTPVLLVAAAGLVILALVFGWPLRQRRALLDRLGQWMRAHWPVPAAGSAAGDESTFSRLLSPSWRMLAAVLLHFGCWMLGAFETWLLFHLMHIPTGLPEAIVIDSLLSTVRTLVFFVPASVGVQEVFYALLGGLFGIAPAQAIAFSLARRARDFALGIPILLIWNVQEARRAWAK